MLVNFDEIIEVVLHHEGGYVNDPKDPGGETNFGIAKRSHPDVDIKNLTKEGAKDIYKEGSGSGSSNSFHRNDEVSYECVGIRGKLPAWRYALFMSVLVSIFPFFGHFLMSLRILLTIVAVILFASFASLLPSSSSLSAFLIKFWKEFLSLRNCFCARSNTFARSANKLCVNTSSPNKFSCVSLTSSVSRT